MNTSTRSVLTVNKALRILGQCTRPKGTLSTIREAEILAWELAREVRRLRREMTKLRKLTLLNAVETA